ncbi:hypothetical protein ACFWTE_11280 [Nocardiopsis sp. NPDC058631]|uniref:hypothetical protein n=1 Tax=Nocardiopsis sp. NPDC058631 TaxID=3346566 RepID=UPI0036570E7A
MLVLIGAALAPGGFVLGTVPVEPAGSECGSSFALGTKYHALMGSVGCSAVRSAHLPWAWALITVGVVVAAGAAAMDWLPRRPAQEPRRSPAEK